MPTTRKRFMQILFGGPVALLVGRLGWRPASAASEVRIKKPAGAWETAEFNFEKAGRSFPGIVVRLPDTAGQASNIYAACRICPHEACVFGFESNYQVVGTIVGVDISNPVFLCRCHLSVFDPARDGKVISGPAKRPPWQFDVRERGDEIAVTGIEDGAGDFR